MERNEQVRGAVSVDYLMQEDAMQSSISYAMKLHSEPDRMEKVNEAIMDVQDVREEEDEETLATGASMQEIKWYVDALEEAVTSVVDDEELENRLLSIML